MYIVVFFVVFVAAAAVAVEYQQSSVYSPVSFGSTTRDGVSYVGFGSDWNPNYSFYVPLTTKIWSRLGFKPLVLLVNDNYNYHHKKEMKELVKRYTQLWGGRIFELSGMDRFVHQAAMVGRMYLACDESLDPSAELMMTDADMWVFDNRLWENKNRSNSVHYYGFMMADPSPDYFDRWGPQMCHLQATIAAWREILDLPVNGCNVTEMIESVLETQRQKEGIQWEYDQLLLHEKLNSWRKRDGVEIDLHRQSVERGFKMMDGRFRQWNREAYQEKTNFAEFHAAHVPRPGYIEEKWVVTREVLSTFLPDEIETIDRYYEEFIKAI